MREDTDEGKSSQSGHAFSPATDVIFYDLYGKPVLVEGYDMVSGIMRPRLSLQMLDDLSWHRAALEQAHQFFLRDFQRVADNDDEALAHLRGLAG
jgi:hypothetical protein